MSTSRRAFFKGLIGGVGALGLGSVILSRQGWFGILGSTEAFAQPNRAVKKIDPKRLIPSTYYDLKPDFVFFEPYKQGDAPTKIPDFLKKLYRIKEDQEASVHRELRERRDKWPNYKKVPGTTEVKPQIIDKKAKLTYELNSSAAFITRLLLMDVSKEFLAKLYASRFGGTEVDALQNINGFIDANPKCFIKKDPPALPTDNPTTETKPFVNLWADFSIGSVWVGGIKYPA